MTDTGDTKLRFFMAYSTQGSPEAKISDAARLLVCYLISPRHAICFAFRSTHAEVLITV